MRKVVLLPALAFMLLMLTSCWNYREVNDLAIVIGAAIDKGMTENYLLTVELLEVGEGRIQRSRLRLCLLKAKRYLML